MKTLYYDCFAGISGDMNLGALIDAGADRAKLEESLRALGINGWRLEISQQSRGGICGTKVDVILEPCAGEESEHCCCRERAAHTEADKSEEHTHHAHNCSCAHSHHHDDDCLSMDSKDKRDCGHGRGHCHEHSHEHRSFADIKKIIAESSLKLKVKRTALQIFTILAEAEAKVHGKSVEDVHFHEVGAVDSIIDIVGAAICFDLLGIDKIAASAVELGSGTVKCAHGIMPVPAPATAELAKNFPSKIGGACHEATTPTGAAILAAMCADYQPKIAGRIVAAGVGVGGRDLPEIANVLRVCIYETADETPDAIREELFLLEANIDDMTGESLAALCEKLLSAACLDAWQEAIVMKKGRLASKVCALCKSEKVVDAEKVFFANSSTLGVRKICVGRTSLLRKETIFESSFGDVRVKTAFFGNAQKSKPEADDIKKIAARTNLGFDNISKKILDEIERNGVD